METKRFDTLIFDLGKVVIDFDSKQAIRRLDGLSPFSDGEMVARLRRSGFMMQFEKGELSNREFFDRVSDVLKLDIGFETFTEIWTDIFVQCPILDEDFLQGLSGHYQLLALSNINPIHADYLRAHFRVLKQFQRLVLSYEVGAMKPEEKIYRTAMDFAGTSPERIFFMDDKPLNVEAALRLGWKGVVFTDKRQLQRDLAHYGIQNSECRESK